MEKLAKTMKGFGFLFLFLMVIGTAACVYLGYSSNGSTSLTTQGIASITNKHAMASTVKSRKLKGEMTPSTGQVSLDDYGLIDPVPSSITSIRPGPIQHGTPLMPYIPKPSPPPTPVRN